MAFRLPYVGYYLLHHGRGWVVWRYIRRTFRPKFGYPFQRILPNARQTLLLAGDSTAFGTGATRPETTIAGLLAQAHPDWSIRVRAKNGLFLTQLPDWLVGAGPADIVVLLCGGNDVLQGVSANKMQAAAQDSVQAAKKISSHVIVVCEGNLGNVPLFPERFRQTLETRARTMRAALRQAAKDQDAVFADIFYERIEDPWRHDPNKFYAIDLFHPGDAGYAMWFEKINQGLNRLSA